MSGYSSHYGPSPQSTSSPKSPNGLRNITVKTERRSSQSSSDDGNFGHRDELPKAESEQDDDGNSLTSQTLNADGTPKRPMNAFMIFARRRRPQVSSQNQSMRTGEISKILSREWVSMPPSDKQFYLEQAKQLKETFNTKYPDYVYRRRPNNSRKRRRSDGTTIRPVDHALLGDHPDDLGGSFDIDTSPTDDDQMDAALYHRSSQDMPHGGAEHKYNPNHSRPSISHSYSSSEHFRSNSQDGHRPPYSGANSSDRVGPGMSGNPSSGVGLNSIPYSYGQSSHAQSPHLFGTDSQQGWQHRGSWIGSGQDRGPPAGSAQKNSYSPSGSWSSPNDSASSATSGNSNYFPTLNTPFYPNQSGPPPFVTSSSSHSVPQQTTSTSQYESVSSMQGREFGPRSYGGSTSSSSGGSYSLGRDPFFQRTLPPMQLGYPPSQPLTSSGNSGPSPASLWRD
jgi:hypothetical protein